MSTCQIMMSTCQIMMSNCHIYVYLSDVVLSADFDICIALIGQEHVLTIYSLTNE